MNSSGKFRGLGTWRRYKLGQAQFTSWLKQTAEKLVARTPECAAAEAGAGEANETDADHGRGQEKEQEEQSRRQQKKKKARAAADAVSIDTAVDPDADKFVHWTQLEELAQRVADNGQPGDVPDAAINILRDVVGLRKKLQPRSRIS